VRSPGHIRALPVNWQHQPDPRACAKTPNCVPNAALFEDYVS
jgi:hypothetical protein